MPGRIFFGRNPSPSSSTSSISSSEQPLTASVTKTKQLKHITTAHMPSIDLRRPSRSGKNGPKSEQPVTIDLNIESPPLLLHGSVGNSSGALLSGQLRLLVTEPEVTIQSLAMELLAKITTKKPVASNCPECATKSNTVFKWEFLRDPMVLKKGVHDFPFSYLLPGHLPATTHGNLGIIDYVLSAKASLDSEEPIKFEHPLLIQRAVMPGPDKTSVRIFPPTNLTANVVLPPVIHSTGAIPVSFRVDGITKREKGIQTRWRLRKVFWRLEEQSKMVSPACAKHSQKVGGPGKGVLHQDTKTIGDGEIKSGWKNDFGECGQVELEFSAAIKTGRRPRCDVDSPTGLSISHTFVVELIVAEEHCYDKTPKSVSPTGAARVLRMQFNMIVTERAGLGISWDEEMPPMYSDVPPSPPLYSNMEDYSGPPLEEVDRLDLN